MDQYTKQLRSLQPTQEQRETFRDKCEEFVAWARDGLPMTFRANCQTYTKQNIFKNMLKFHYLERHVPDFMEAHGTIGMFSEQSLEHYGQRLKKAFNERKEVWEPEQPLRQVQGVLDNAFDRHLRKL